MDIMEPPLQQQSKPTNSAEPVVAVESLKQPSPEEKARIEALMSHDVFAAHVDNGKEHPIVFGCRKCGAYTWRGRDKLLQRCPGRPTSVYMRP